MTGVPAGAYLRPDLEEVGFSCDTVIFDVDGVLVDVRGSFREAIRATAAHVQRLMGVTEPWTPSAGDITLFKRAGGFNDDIDMSIAMTAIGAAGRGADLAAIAAAVESAGGGLRALREVAPDLPRIEGRLVLRVFDERYWGRDQYQRLFGEPATYVDTGAGLADTERPLVGADLIGRLHRAGVARVALITGRTTIELAAALTRIGWAMTELAQVVTGEMLRKPDPACIDAVVEACGSRAAIYVGDVRDDWELVRRYRAERPDGAAIRAVLVGDNAEMRTYRDLGVDATVQRTEDIIPLLLAWRARATGA